MALSVSQMFNPQRMMLFAEHYAGSGNATRAAASVGASRASAATLGARWLRDSRVQAYIREAVTERFATAAPLALAIILELMADKTTPPSTRLAAAREVLALSGRVPPKRSEAKTPNMWDRRLEDYTRAELEAAVAETSGDISRSIPYDKK